MYSCQKDDEFKKYNQEDFISISEPRPENITRLGKKLENPYSVANMQRALDTILKEVKKVESYQAKSFQQSAEQIEIKKTDLYVRFLPKDSLELNLLETDSTLVLFDHPLDYEIEHEGEYYHDPEIPEDQISWQYSVVKPNYVFPDVRYEVLSDLFIPENSDLYWEEPTQKGQARVSFSNPVNLAQLETVSLYLTGNLSDEELKKQKEKTDEFGRSCIWFICWDVPDRWNPSGTIRLWDDRLNSYHPMQGVKVRARRWFTVKTGNTNSNGYFRTGSFRRPVHYSIKWERQHFSVKWSWWLFWSTTAWYNGPKQKSPWNLQIRGGTQQYYATIFQAAHDYYYRHSFGLTKPSRYGGFWRMRLRARKENGRSSYVKARRLFNGSDISIQEWGRESEFVYGTTIHELAHAAHRKVDGSAYNSLVWKAYTSPCAPSAESCDNPGPTGAGARRVMETWATAVEISLTNLRYTDYLGEIGYRYRDNLQWQTIADEDFYTTVGFDLTDDENQRNTWGATRPIDRVDGYTIKDVENALRGAKTWGQWRDNMIRIKPSNPTSDNIEELFNNY